MHFVFFTLPRFTLLSLSSAIDVLRMANRVLDQQAYSWTIASVDGQPVESSSGLSFSQTQAIAEVSNPDVVFVCGGVDVRSAVTEPIIQALRNLDRKGVTLGGLCTGVYALAKAQLLSKHKTAIHWENLSSMREEFPHVDFVDHVYALDGQRFTSSGGIAPLDLMLTLVKKHHGRHVAQKISEQFILERIRREDEKQYVPLAVRAGFYQLNLIEAAALMEANIEEPLPLDEIARLVGVSRRQIERLFKRYIGKVPVRYYLELRLNRARQLLLQTTMSVMEVAVACGFQSPPHFSKCYREFFGHSPTQERVTGQ
jgi:transcriptional regulator GlxA family with amidase domain